MVWIEVNFLAEILFHYFCSFASDQFTNYLLADNSFLTGRQYWKKDFVLLNGRVIISKRIIENKKRKIWFSTSEIENQFNISSKQIYIFALNIWSF